MSYFIGSSICNVSAQDLNDLRMGRFDEISKVFSLEISKEGSYPLKRKPIRWDPYMGCLLLKAFEDKTFPYRRYLKELRIEGFFRELELFAISLDAYIESKYSIPVDKIIYLASIGPRGSKVLKEARKLLFKRKIEAIDFIDQSYDPLVEDLIKDLPLDDIDNVFNYRYMPLWEEDIHDLEENSEIPLDTQQEFIAEFEESLRDLLKSVEITSEDNRFDILLTTSRSISLDSHEKKHNFLRKQKSLSISEENFSQEIGEAVRTIIPVSPQSFRDAVIVDWKSTNTIRLIEYRIRKILDYLPYHNYTDKQDSFITDVKHFYEYGYTYVCRDIQKEGLTKPRYLLELMLRVISEKDPILKPYIEFYNSFSIKDYGIPIRGNGQGMANALTTLMQVVIIQMINASLASRGFSEVITAMCYNDDNVTKVPSDILDDFWEIEGEIMKGLGIIRSDKKSFHSKLGFIYCEMYMSPLFPKCNLKQVVSRRNILFSLLYDFPYEVKEYLKSQVGNTYLKFYLEEIAHTIGYEFFPDEIRYPLSLGGWIPDLIYGFSTGLLDLEELPYDIRIPCMYEASKITSYKAPLPRFIIERYEKEVSIFDRIFPEYGKEIGKYLPTGKWKDLYHKYGLWRENPKLDFLTRKKIHEKRKRKFSERKKLFPSLRDFQNELILEKKFIFPEWALKFKIPHNFYKNIMRDPYKQDTPIENYLSKLGLSFDHRSPYREEYSIRNSNFKFDLRKDELFISSPDLDYEELAAIPIEPESFESVDRFIDNTCLFLLAHYRVYHRAVILSYDLPKNELKEEVYGEFLSLDSFIELADSKYDRWNYTYLKKISSLIAEKGLTEEEIDELIAESKNIPTQHQEEYAESESDIGPEEAERLREMALSIQKRLQPKKLTVESLQAILLAKDNPDEYEYSEILNPLVAPVLFFYNRHDSIRDDYKERLRSTFSKLLENDYLKTLLVSVFQEGYHRRLGEALGLLEEDEGSLEDFCISFGDD